MSEFDGDVGGGRRPRDPGEHPDRLTPPPSLERDASLANSGGLDLPEPPNDTSLYFTPSRGRWLSAGLIDLNRTVSRTSLYFGDADVTHGKSSEIRGSATGEEHPVREIGSSSGVSRVDRAFEGIGRARSTEFTQPRRIGEFGDMAPIYKASELAVVSLPGRGDPRISWLFRRTVTNARFTSNLVAIAGNSNEVDVRSRYSISKVRIDVKSFTRNLSTASRVALRRFVMHPKSTAACSRFQETLPRESPHSTELTSREYKAAPQVAASIVDCDIAVIGDNNRSVVKSYRRAATGVLRLDQLLGQDAALAMAFADHLAHPDNDALRDKFDEQVVRSMTPEVLGSLLDTASFGSCRTSVTGIGGSASVRNADVVMLGARNEARSVIEISVHRVTPIEALRIKALADEVGPVTAAPTKYPSATPPPFDPEPILGLQRRRRWAEVERRRRRRTK
jgi:hypothetical protein